MTGTLLRLVHRERVLLAGGQRALVMQLAHPLVAAGVAEHSEFPLDAFARLRRTVDLTLSVVYGTAEESTDAVAAIRSVHRRVTGSAQVGSRSLRYRAEDPALLLWVHSTLIDTTLTVFPLFVRPLSDWERRRYYDESRELARSFGIPDDAIPADLGRFRGYVRGVLDGPDLFVTDASLRLARSVLRPPAPLVARPVVEAARLITLALLPERVLEVFGLRAGRSARLALAASSRASRLAIPLLPRRIRSFARAREAEREQ